MTKMSKAQRTAIIDFHNGVTGKGHTMLAGSRTIAVLVREGWAVYPAHVTSAVARVGKVRVAHVTTAGLIAAGVDMDAIHAEALAEDRERDHGWALIERDERDQAARTARIMDTLHGDAIAEDRARTAVARRAAPDIVLTVPHAEHPDVAEVWRTINSPQGFRPADVRPVLDRIEKALRAAQ